MYSRGLEGKPSSSYFLVDISASVILDFFLKKKCFAIRSSCIMTLCSQMVTLCSSWPFPTSGSDLLFLPFLLPSLVAAKKWQHLKMTHRRALCASSSSPRIIDWVHGSTGGPQFLVNLQLGSHLMIYSAEPGGAPTLDRPQNKEEADACSDEWNKKAKNKGQCQFN